MGAWSKASRSHADYMNGGDFFSSEQSAPWTRPQTVRIEFVNKDGQVEAEKELALQEGEVLDSMFMSSKEAARLLRTDPAGLQGNRRDVVPARQGHHDEGVPPDRVRPRGQGVLPDRCSRNTASCSTNWASTPTTA
jgi:hypothetical protein